jgi:ABC-type polysaccharide/polyol phosphate export permease
MSLINKVFQPILVTFPSSNRWERIWKLAQVDFKKRYYNDRFGLFWALLNPLFRVFVYYIAFTHLLGRGGASVDNFALFLFSALIFWMEFVQTLKKGILLIQQKSYLIENIQLNKIDLYLSLVTSSVLGFSFNLLAYFFFATLFQIAYGWNLIFLPLLVINLYLLGIGGSMILAIVYIYFKDIMHIIDILILFGFWTSGIFFDSQIVLNIFPPAYYINPFLGIIENVRNIILYNQPLNYHIFIINFLFGIVVVVIGYNLLMRYSHLAIERK